MRTRSLFRWVMAVLFIPLSYTVFGITTCNFEGTGDVNDDDKVIVYEL